MEMTVQNLCDLAVEHNLVPDAMFYDWEHAGGWQKQVCNYFGGARDKTILDIGCGPLRFGAFILNELGSGHFYGVEPFLPYVNIGLELAERLGGRDKVTLIHTDMFEFPLDIQVDFAMAHAVFTHLSHEQILICLERMEKVMIKGSSFVFTYNLNRREAPTHRGRLYARQLPLISVHLPSDQVFTNFCEPRGLSFRSFDEIPHGQQCGVISF